MHHFHYKDRELYCEEVPVSAIVEESGTPVYIYSQRTITENFKRLESALSSLDAMICYAVKANSSLGILNLMSSLNAGFDIVSAGELEKIYLAGGDTEKCVFAGVGKTAEEIESAIKVGIFSFNVESEPEMARINMIAGKLGKKAPVSIRVNPNVDAGTHQKITTGTYENKFGIAFEKVLDLYQRASKEYPNLVLKGVQMHIGSQLTHVEPYVQAIKKMQPLVSELKEKFGIQFFSIGGGIGIPYESALESGSANWWKAEGKDFITPEGVAEAIIPLLQPFGVQILLEPGRFIVGNSGILVTQVEYVKQTGDKNFVVVDAGMNDLIRPAMYDSYHQIVPLEQDEDSSFTADVVGPICESGDCFCKNRKLPQVTEGDYLAIMSAGAYGFAMASTYNSRPLPAEVIVNGDDADYLRVRQASRAMWVGEGVPYWMEPEGEESSEEHHHCCGRGGCHCHHEENDHSGDCHCNEERDQCKCHHENGAEHGKSGHCCRKKSS